MKKKPVKRKPQKLRKKRMPKQRKKLQRKGKPQKLKPRRMQPSVRQKQQPKQKQQQMQLKLDLVVEMEDLVMEVAHPILLAKETKGLVIVAIQVRMGTQMQEKVLTLEELVDLVERLTKEFSQVTLVIIMEESYSIFASTDQEM